MGSGSPVLRTVRTALRAAVIVALVALPALVPARAGAIEPRDDLTGLLCSLLPPLDVVLPCSAATPPAQVPPQAASGGTERTPTPPALPDTTPPTAPVAPRYVDDILLIRFKSGVSQQDQTDELARAGVTAVRRIDAIGVTVVQMPPEHRNDALAELESSPLVADAERDVVMQQLDTTPNDTYWQSQWGLRRADFPSAWDHTRGLGSVVVAVLDTGVDAALPDIQNVASGFNFDSPGAPPSDDNGHGTSVAGIVAAHTDNREGVAGVCWSCSILPIKVLGADGTGDTALVAEGIVHAADAGARVISMSLGAPADDETLDEAVTYAISKGAILVAAAGNNGSSTPFYPAATPGVLGVAATDQNDRLYSWSDYGSWAKVAAPGCNPAPSSSGGYVNFCGTSSATPVVSGLAALLLSEQPLATRDDVIQAIEETTVPIGSGVDYGRIDAAAALAKLGDAAVVPALRAAPSSTLPVSIATLRGRLTKRVRSRTYRLTLGPLLVRASLRFTGARTLTLAVRDGSGHIVARAGGRSPLRLARPLPSGTFTFAVSGRTRASYTLSLSGSG
ncbi:MAG TPA: S8 family peptidase [Gaiellaceae bacterium]|nr:S8 family peptidase [Gaiellaceae bacterium]